MKEQEEENQENLSTDKCDKNNPNDPHYNDRDSGDYNQSCVWIWDIGKQ